MLALLCRGLRVEVGAVSAFGIPRRERMIMTFRTSRLALAAMALLALSACSSSAGADEASSGTGGTIEMAVSDTCTAGSDSQCVSVNGESVLLPSTFEEADVKDSSVAESGQSTVDVTFTADGAKVWQELSEEAVGAGDSARLVIKVGDELQSAVRVMEAMKGDQVQIALGPDGNAQDLVDLIQGN
jgi:preprotein translocase subunit SecD